MKNKHNFLILIFLIFLISVENINANDFFFESKEIEIKDNGNLVIGKGDVKIISGKNNLLIYSDKSEYNKINNKINLFGNVEIIDQTRNLIIKGNEFIYYKNLKKIVSIGKTFINTKNGYLIRSSDIHYLGLDNEIKSNQSTLITDSYDNNAITKDFVFNTLDKTLKLSNVELIDNKKNSYFGKNSIIDLKTKNILSKDPELYFSETSTTEKNSRLKGNSMIKTQNRTIISKGIFTNCKPNDQCPPWSIEAEKITHDLDKKKITYDKSWLRLYNKRVFYFPKFFHPDPTVDRQSGFLMPSISSSKKSGESINTPYYKVLSDNKDLTLTPKIFLNGDFLIQNEYRQVEKNSEHVTDFSIKKDTENSKSHLFSKNTFLLNSEYFDNSELNIDIQKVSNDTYLKNENIVSSINESNTLLQSKASYTASNNDMDILLETMVYEDLSQIKDSDKHQFILPSFRLSKLVFSNLNLNGDAKFEVIGANQIKNTNNNEKYLINNFKYNSNNKISKKGFITNFGLLFKNSTKDGKNSNKYQKGIKSDNYFLANYNLTYPMLKKTNNFNKYLTPKILAMYSPFENDIIRNNEKSINIDNIFFSNRLNLLDSVEGNQSLTLGADYEINSLNNKRIFKSSLGQVYKIENDKNLPKTSTLQNKSSDIVGEFIFEPNKYFSLDQQFSLDNHLKTLNYNLVKSKISLNNFITNFEYLEENNDIGSDSYFSRKFEYSFNQSNSITFNTRRNRKRDLTEFYNLIYEYKNDCLIASIKYNKDYYNDRDSKPNEELFFSLTITPFASINSPNF